MIDLPENEPLSRLFIKQWKFTPQKMYVLMVFVYIAFEIIPGLVFNLRTNNSNYMGVLQDTSGLVLGFILIPSSWAFYIWLPINVNKNLDYLLNKSGVVRGNDIEECKKIIQRISHFTAKKSYKTLSIFLTIVITLIAQLISARYDPPSWVFLCPTYNFILGIRVR